MLTLPAGGAEASVLTVLLAVVGAVVPPVLAVLLPVVVTVEDAVVLAVVDAVVDAVVAAGGVVASETFLLLLLHAADTRVSPRASAANVLRLVLITLNCLLSGSGGKEFRYLSSESVHQRTKTRPLPVLSSPINTGVSTIAPLMSSE
jgi:hypothetical protein